MKKTETNSVKDCILHNLYSKLFSLIAIALLITAFFIPPTAFIDGSVLAAVGEIFAFAALGTVVKAIDKGTKATLQHNNTSLTVGGEELDSNVNIDEFPDNIDEV